MPEKQTRTYTKSHWLTDVYSFVPQQVGRYAALTVCMLVMNKFLFAHELYLTRFPEICRVGNISHTL